MDFSKLSGKLQVFLLFFFGLTLVFWPILSGEKILNDNYVTNYAVGQTGYNFYKDFGDSLRQGHLQLWWSSYMAGFPVYLTQIGFFNPLGILLFSLFDYILAYNWLIFINFLLGGLAMYWFVRNLGLSISASLIAGFAWALSFNNIQYGSIPIFGNAFLFIPLFFCAILKLSEGDKKYLLFGSLISGFGFIAGMTNIVFYTFIAGLAFAVFLGWPKFFNKTLRGYIFIVLGGAVLASIWLLPVLNYLPFTLRGEATSASIFYDYLKIGDILKFFYPFIQLPGFGGVSLLSGVANLYVGIVPLLLAIVAIFSWRKNKFIAFWTALFVFAFSMRLWFFPIFQWTQFLPIFNRFRAPFHWYTLAFFSLATLSAYGLDYLKDIKEARWFKNFVKGLGIFAAINFLLILTVNIVLRFWGSNILKIILDYFDKNYYSPAKKFPIEHYHTVITKVFNDSAYSFSIFNYQFLVPFIFILIGTTLFIFYRKNYLNFNKFKILAVAASILNLVLIWQGYYNFTPKSLITNPPNTVAFIKNLKDSNNFRVFRFYPPEMYQEFKFYDLKNPLDYDIKTLGLQINPYWIDGFGGGEPFRSQRISEILDEIGYEIPATYTKPVWLKSNDLTLAQKISRFSSLENQNLLSMLNIKYVFSSFELPNLKLIYETTATEKNIPVYIYENTKAMPRIYFAKNVKFVDSEKAFEELLKVKDFRELTLIECQKDCSSQVPSSPDGKAIEDPRQSRDKLQVPSSVVIQEFKPQFIKIKTSGNGWLVYSDANLPTWEAYVDNQKTQIYTANYLFKAVFVPKGEHEIIFKYPGLWGQFLISNFQFLILFVGADGKEVSIF